MANFPYISDDTGVHPLQPQAILLGVASANNGTPVFQVSTTNSITTTSSPLSADSSRVSAVQGDAGLLHTSAFNQDANQMHVSGFSPDASLFRVSAIGGTTGDRTLVDGTTQTISATLTPVSASPAGTIAGLVTNPQAYDASKFRVSAILAAGVSSTGAASFGVSAAQIDAGVFHASAFVDSGSISAKNQDANFMHVSGFSPDAGLFRVSTLGTFLSANQQISAVLLGGTSNIGDVSAIVTNSVSATADNFRASAFESVVTTNTGGASMFSTSGGIAVVSTVKSAAGRLYGYHLGNPAGVDQYLQVFNASGGATLGTDVPALTLVVPAGTGANQGSGAIMSLGAGIGFSNGIQVAATSTATGNTAGASAVRVNVFYA